MMDLQWLRVCAEGQTEGCVAPVQIGYLAAIVLGIVLLAWIGSRSRAFATATLALMPVAIAIDIAVGSIAVALKLPLYLDSIGTVLVGVLAGPWAGALTGILADLIWSILPIPGGAGPVTAFFAPVAGVIGLMAGFWASQGVFRLHADDTREGRFLALSLGVGGALVAMLAVQQTVGLTFGGDDAGVQNRSVTLSVAIIALAVLVAWLSRRTIFKFRPNDPRIAAYLAAATAVAAGILVFAILRLLFAPLGYFSTIAGTDKSVLWGANLTGLAVVDPVGLAGALALGLVAAVLSGRWASRGDRGRLFPVWVGGVTTGVVAAAMSAPIAAGVFGGVTGSGVDAIVAIYRTLGLNVFQSAFAQGLTSDPLDKTLSYTVVFVIVSALPVTFRSMFRHGESTIVMDSPIAPDPTIAQANR